MVMIFFNSLPNPFVVFSYCKGNVDTIKIVTKSVSFSVVLFRIETFLEKMLGANTFRASLVVTFHIFIVYKMVVL